MPRCPLNSFVHDQSHPSMSFRIWRTTWAAKRRLTIIVIKKKIITFFLVFYFNKISCIVESRDKNWRWRRCSERLRMPISCSSSPFPNSFLSFLLSSLISSQSHTSHLPISLPPFIQLFLTKQKKKKTEEGTAVVYAESEEHHSPISEWSPPFLAPTQSGVHFPRETTERFHSQALLWG